MRASCAIGVLCLATLTQANDWVPTNTARLLELIKDTDFGEGFVLGLQEDPDDETSLCFTDYQGVKTAYTTLTADGWTVNTATLFERACDLGSQFYSTYNDCFFDSIAISLGVATQSFSGFFDKATAFVMESVGSKAIDGADTAYNTFLATYDDGSTAAKDVGKSFGGSIKVFSNMEVPTAQL